jgi:nicotinamide-nucleotide amidase
MNVTLCSIGDEVRIGQVINTNASWIAAACTAIGCTVGEHVTIGDEASLITSTLDRLCLVSDVVIMTGGLGPTHDDITKDVVAVYTHDTLTESAEWLSHLNAWMSQRGRELTERNQRQALLPSRATILPNPHGTAAGMLLHHNGTVLVVLPGVPTEMKAIMDQSVLPWLAARIAESTVASTTYRTLMTVGIAESSLADLLGDPSQFLGTSTLAFLPNYLGVRMRVGATGTTQQERNDELDRVCSYIYERAQRFIYAEGEHSLAEVVGRLLTERGETLSVAESCTGGLLGAACTDVSGSSAWFMGGMLVYSNESKIQQLGVDASVIDQQGAVSEPVAIALANGVRSRFGTTYGIGITGIAGPTGGSEAKPVGTVWIALAGPTVTDVHRFQFGNDRRITRERSVGAALGLLWKIIR